MEVSYYITIWRHSLEDHDLNYSVLVLWNVCVNAFLTFTLDGGKWSPSRVDRFTPAERASGTRWIGGWVGPRIGLDAVEKKEPG
jgi:hypothetical protein